MKLIKAKNGNKTYKYEPKIKHTEDMLKSYLSEMGEPGYLFREYTGESIDGLIEYDDTSNVTSMYYMFYNCTNLQTIPQLNTSKVTNMKFMFRGCTNLQTIPLLNTSNVTDMGYMFEECTNLQTIPQLDTSKVTNMSYMFNNCKNLKTIDIISMDKITASYANSQLCYSCYSLTKLIIRNMTKTPALNTTAFTNCYHFDGTANSDYNPEGLKDGRIYVPDNMVDSLKTATNWSKYADIIVPLSSLEE